VNTERSLRTYGLVALTRKSGSTANIPPSRWAASIDLEKASASAWSRRAADSAAGSKPATRLPMKSGGKFTEPIWQRISVRPASRKRRGSCRPIRPLAQESPMAWTARR
jgi:hypothetical protein